MSAVAAASRSYNARLAARVDYTPSLASFWVLPDAPPPPFVPGQYVTIGVEAAGRLIQRAYSVASSPREIDRGYELYIRLVDGGALTPLLFGLEVGHGLSFRGPKGKFTLDPADARAHLFISTGTGIAPFLSMMKTLMIDGAPRRAVVVQGVSYPDDLSHRALLSGWQSSGAYPITYVPTISRPDAPESLGWSGRTGRAEAILGAVLEEQRLSPDNAVAYLCGNPGMVVAAEGILAARGFAAADIRKELYWPKVKPAPVESAVHA